MSEEKRTYDVNGHSIEFTDDKNVIVVDGKVVAKADILGIHVMTLKAEVKTLTFLLQAAHDTIVALIHDLGERNLVDADKYVARTPEIIDITNDNTPFTA